jgi:superfamily II DNA or RNA helicase
MLMAATGSGKTVTALMLILNALKKSRTATFVCDRTTLINQTSEVADSYGLKGHGVIQAQHWRFDLEMPFQIASAQTLARRSFPDSDLYVIDEAHTQYEKLTGFIKSCRAIVVGLSATPFTKGLGKIYTNLINAATMHELTEQGTLVPFRVFSCTKVNMKGAKIIAGEWSDKAVEERGMDILGEVVREWKKFALGLKTLVFGATIRHCEDMCRQFNAEGILAMTFTNDTTDKERKVILEEFRKPNSAIRVLLSVEALAKGFDVPDIGCICDVRPLRKSLSTFMQMFGRGLRSSPSTGKKECLLLDFSGNIVRFADDFSEIYYNGLDQLDKGEKLDRTVREDEEREPAKCPECGFTPCGKRCVSCGYERKSLLVIEHKEGEMHEIMIGKRKMADNPKHLWEQLCTYTKYKGNPITASGRAWYLFQAMAGTRPDPAWKFDDQPDVMITTNVMNQIKYRNIHWHKGHGRS